MNKTLLAAAASAALLSLGACNNEPETLTVGPDDPQAQALQNAAPVEAPPMIQASKTFRCKDNSLLYADYYTNNTVRVRTVKDGTPTVLTAEGGNPPFTADGYSLSANGPSVTFTAPGKGAQTCKG